MIGRVHIQEAFKLALSLVLFYWLALWMNWDLPKYGALAIVLISLGTAGASFQKGLLRILGTTVGLTVGMLVVALFAQDRWLTLLFLCSYLLIIGYFIQGSRYPYAWFVTGFLPPLVWSTTYGDVDNAFHYASFRYLETTAGVLIYTCISILLWPIRAGDALNKQGGDLWPGIRQLLGFYRRQLETGEPIADAAALRLKLDGAAAQMLATLQAAYADTPSVMARKREWETLGANLRAFGDALALWHECIDDARRLDLGGLLPGLGSVLDGIDRRVARIVELWPASAADADASDAADADGTLLEPLPLHLDRAAGAALSHFDRAALLGFVQQLNTLDETSRTLLRTMRVLAALDRSRRQEADSTQAHRSPLSGWDPTRLIKACLPPVSFAAAFVFWILVDPPTGPSIPNMASVWGLLLLLLPVNGLVLVAVLVAVTWVAVAPLYFFVMPRLDSGVGLLTLIFAYAFAFSIIGVRKPALKVPALAMFVMMTGISNDQVYSFLGLVNGALMMILAMAFVAIVQMLMTPARPEHVLLSGVRRFFRGCAGVVGEPARLRRYESMVLPAPGRLRAAEKKLAYKDFPDNSKEKVQRLLDAIQSIALRVHALGAAHERVARHAVEWSGPLQAVRQQLRDRMQRLFEKWACLQHVDTIDERIAFRELGRSLEDQLDDLTREHPDRLDDRVLGDLYALLGCARGLVHAVAEAQPVMEEINWDQWAEARF